MITDVNLPEHRGTVIGLSRMCRAVGNALSVWLAGWLFAWLNGRLPEPDNYAYGLALFQILVIPAFICYLMLQKYLAHDKQAATATLAARAQTTQN